jgi:uncharacterized repeat protein (TIGR03847 family)
VKVYELNPVEAITADAVGEPGRRVFYIQARTVDEIVTLVAEKEQVHLLARGIQTFLAELDAKIKPQGEDPPVGPLDLELRGPFEPNFRVAQLGLDYDEETDRVVLVAQALVADDLDEEDEAGVADEPEAEAAIARFWATRTQMRVMAQHAIAVVSRGRPICPLCGRPEDAEGHFCPKRNGHSRMLVTP